MSACAPRLADEGMRESGRVEHRPVEKIDLPVPLTVGLGVVAGQPFQPLHIVIVQAAQERGGQGRQGEGSSTYLHRPLPFQRLLPL